MTKTTPLPTIRVGGRDLPAILDEVTALAPGRVLIDPTMVAAAARAWSDNTIRAFLSDIRLWDDWCRQSGTSSSSASPAMVAAYVRTLSGQAIENLPATTLKPRAAATIAPLGPHRLGLPHGGAR